MPTPCSWAMSPRSSRNTWPGAITPRGAGVRVIERLQVVGQGVWVGQVVWVGKVVWSGRGQEVAVGRGGLRGAAVVGCGRVVCGRVVTWGRTSPGGRRSRTAAPAPPGG